MAISKTQPMRPAEIQLVDEVNAHTNHLSRLDGSVAALTESLSDEIEDREQADAQLQNNIGVEAQARADADTALSGRINAESQTRSDADTALGARIDGTNALIPASAFTSTNTVKKYVDDETTARTNADTALSELISAEVQNRVGADTAIESKIGSGFDSTNTVAKAISDLNTLLGSATPYMSPLINAINDLNTRVSALESA